MSLKTVNISVKPGDPIGLGANILLSCLQSEAPLVRCKCPEREIGNFQDTLPRDNGVAYNMVSDANSRLEAMRSKTLTFKGAIIESFRLIKADGTITRYLGPGQIGFAVKIANKEDTWPNDWKELIFTFLPRFVGKKRPTATSVPKQESASSNEPWVGEPPPMQMGSSAPKQDQTMFSILTKSFSGLVSNSMCVRPFKNALFYFYIQDTVPIKDFFNTKAIFQSISFIVPWTVRKGVLDIQKKDAYVELTYAYFSVLYSVIRNLRPKTATKLNYIENAGYLALGAIPVLASVLAKEGSAYFPSDILRMISKVAVPAHMIDCCFLLFHICNALTDLSSLAPTGAKFLDVLRRVKSGIKSIISLADISEMKKLTAKEIFTKAVVALGLIATTTALMISQYENILKIYTIHSSKYEKFSKLTYQSLPELPNYPTTRQNSLAVMKSLVDSPKARTFGNIETVKMILKHPDKKEANLLGNAQALYDHIHGTNKVGPGSSISPIQEYNDDIYNNFHVPNISVCLLLAKFIMCRSSSGSSSLPTEPAKEENTLKRKRPETVTRKRSMPRGTMGSQLINMPRHMGLSNYEDEEIRKRQRVTAA
jgi:hypothetical protein